MKKILLMFIASLSFITLFSCSEDEVEQLCVLSIQIEGVNEASMYTKFQVKLTEQKSGAITKAAVNDKGVATATLPLGTYKITAEDAENGACTMYGAIDNFTLSQKNADLKLVVKPILETLDKTFVLDELFFNCSSNDGAYDRNYYEEYLSIKNISNQPLYADGLSVAIAADPNDSEAGEMAEYLKKDKIVISQLYTIPGKGREHLVQPGQSIVIAHSAVDHSEGGKKAKARNLTGANFELFVPHQYAMTVDNPEVDNMIVNFSTFQAFQWGYGGGISIMLVKTKEDATQYCNENKVAMINPNAYTTKKQDYVVLPTNTIIDGVEIGAKGSLVHKALPNNIDRDAVLIDDTPGMMGGFKGLFVQRKTAEKGYLQDTNNSTDDFVVIANGQKNYIKK